MPKEKTLTELRNKFRSRALDPDGLFLLNADIALEYIDAGKASGLKLLGVDGFRITEQGAYQPSQEFSTDIVDFNGDAVACELRSRDLLALGAPLGIRYEIVFGE